MSNGTDADKHVQVSGLNSTAVGSLPSYQALYLSAPAAQQSHDSKGYFWEPKWQKWAVIHQPSHWRGWVQKPGLGATLLSGLFPCDWRDAESGPNWVWWLNCPFHDLAVAELPSTDWRLFPPSNLQSPEFNSPKSITAHGEGAWLTQQPSNCF